MNKPGDLLNNHAASAPSNQYQPNLSMAEAHHPHQRSHQTSLRELNGSESQGRSAVDPGHRSAPPSACIIRSNGLTAAAEVADRIGPITPSIPNQRWLDHRSLVRDEIAGQPLSPSSVRPFSLGVIASQADENQGEGAVVTQRRRRHRRSRHKHDDYGQNDRHTTCDHRHSRSAYQHTASQQSNHLSGRMNQHDNIEEETTFDLSFDVTIHQQNEIDVQRTHSGTPRSLRRSSPQAANIARGFNHSFAFAGGAIEDGLDYAASRASNRADNRRRSTHGEYMPQLIRQDATLRPREEIQSGGRDTGDPGPVPSVFPSIGGQFRHDLAGVVPRHADRQHRGSGASARDPPLGSCQHLLRTPTQRLVPQRSFPQAKAPSREDVVQHRGTSPPQVGSSATQAMVSPSEPPTPPQSHVSLASVHPSDAIDGRHRRERRSGRPPRKPERSTRDRRTWPHSAALSGLYGRQARDEVRRRAAEPTSIQQLRHGLNRLGDIFGRRRGSGSDRPRTGQ